MIYELLDDIKRISGSERVTIGWSPAHKTLRKDWNVRFTGETPTAGC
jgi:hypothetical protein